MTGHVSSALYIYSEEGREYIERIRENPYGTTIEPVSFETLLKHETEYLQDCSHAVVCGPLKVIKKVMHLAMSHKFSMGIIPLPSQPILATSYGLPKDSTGALALALSRDPKDLDIVLCNDQIVLLRANVGSIPLVDSPENSSKSKILIDGLKRIFSLRLLPFAITATGEKTIALSTAACGCILFATPQRIFASRLIAHDSSFSDGLLSMVVLAPKSVIDYLWLMILTLTGMKSDSVPDSIGFIKSPEIKIEVENGISFMIDGENIIRAPVDFRVITGAIRVNHGKDEALEKKRSTPGREKFITNSLPAGKELEKARNKKIPFFTYASEERFKDLFTALRQDAGLNVSYFVLMVLSTLLATVGLYMNSASVVIGAMLLAPLMAPIIALAMGLLRMDKILFRQSLRKIFIGVLLALSTGAVLTMLFPFQPFTEEMQGRLHPTVLDLIVAVSAGVAGAYTKSYKEILQSLAGVAIAVALVPPLATAGIGIGRLDVDFFNQAFLLFLTNLIGIILAATFTFRILGFSPVVRDKRGLIVVFLFFVLVSIPLFMAYQDISAKAAFEKSWKIERFLVNGKYLIVQNANLTRIHNNHVLTVEILARDQLNRYDLNEFKRKVGKNFSDDLIIRAKIIYIP